MDPNNLRGTCSGDYIFQNDKDLTLQRLSRVRCFVLDMDGTIYLSSRLFPFTIPFLQKLEETGRNYCFFTNNSSANKQDYVRKLTKMGIPAAPE